MAKLALFIDHPRCSVDGINAIINALQSQHTFKIFTRHKIIYDNFFDDVDCIIVPGGTGDVDTFDKVMKHHRQTIKDYVDNGGHYLGICMGAYWAGSKYLDLVKGRDCVQFMNRPGSKTKRPHPKDLEVKWLGKEEKIYWYDGCSIIGNGRMDIVSTYPNGDVMAGYQGRVGLIGSHPEADENWYGCHSWMKKKWNPSKQHNWNLLLDFTNELIKR